MKASALFILCISLLSLLNPAVAQRSEPPLKMVQFILSPNRPDYNYELFESATISISAFYQGVPIHNAKIIYEFGPEMMPAEKSDTIFLKNGTGILNIGTLTKPGFKQLLVKTEFDGHFYKDQIKVGYLASKIKATVELPEDFTSFWDKATLENKKIAIDPEVTLMPDYSNDSIDVYLVQYQNYAIDSLIYGYMCKPKKPGKYPAVLIPPGAGVKKIIPSTEYAEAGFISLHIEIHGISPELTEKRYKALKEEMGNYWFHNLENPDTYYYKRVYLGCLRGIDFLKKQKEFDGTNIGTTGGSQGGALAIVTAALHPDVKFVAAFYPALCDQTGYLEGRAGGWPHTFGLKHFAENNSPAKRETVKYYDVVNFARILKVPGFYSFGYNDKTCPPTSIFSAINSIEASKDVLITPISGHWRFNESQEEAIKWMRQQCGLE